MYGGLYSVVSEVDVRCMGGLYSVVSEGDVRCIGGCIVWSVREI